VAPPTLMAKPKEAFRLGRTGPFDFRRAWRPSYYSDGAHQNEYWAAELKGRQSKFKDRRILVLLTCRADTPYSAIKSAIEFHQERYGPDNVRVRRWRVRESEVTEQANDSEFDEAQSDEPIILRQEEKPMAFEVKDNTGSMFVNDKKTEPNHADRSGNAVIGGVEYWVNGWVRKSKEGKQYLSLSFKRKDTKSAKAPKDDFADDFSI
jgi:Pentaxin family